MIAYPVGSGALPPGAAPVKAPPPAPIDLKTTFGPDRSMTVKTPGYSAPGFSLPPDLLALLIASEQPKQAAPAAYAPPVAMPTQPQPGYRREEEGPRYTPTLGTGATEKKAPARVTRQRLLKGYQDPRAADVWAGAQGSKAMNQGTEITEYQLPDGSWSGDAVYGTLEGNEAGTRGIRYGAPAGPSNLRGMREQMEDDFAAAVGGASGLAREITAPLPNGSTHATSGAEMVSRIPDMSAAAPSGGSPAATRMAQRGAVAAPMPQPVQDGEDFSGVTGGGSRSPQVPYLRGPVNAYVGVRR